MILVTTRGWVSGVFEATHPLGLDEWRGPDGEANPLDIADQIAAWLDDPARPWSSAVSNVSITFEPHTNGQLRPVLSYSGTAFTGFYFDFEVSGRFGDFDTLPTFGSLGATADTIGWERWDQGRGDRSQAGGWRFGHAATAHRQPRVRYHCSASAYQRFRVGLAEAAQPRTAYIYDEAAQLWRFVALGKVEMEHPDEDTMLTALSLECVGGS
jgi:hypothetical protein